MMNYKINNGDYLWKIVRNEYADKNLTNAKIKTIVNEIAKTNNIKNPDLIHAGNTIKLPSYDSIFLETVKKDEGAAHLQQKDYDKWISENYNNYIPGYEVPDYDIAGIECGEEGFEEGWKTGIENLASNNLASLDSNGDGAVDYSEYAAKEIVSYNEMFPDDMIELDNATGKIKNNEVLSEHVEKSFSALDADKSGKIELDEIKAFFAALDGLDSSNQMADGKIKYSAAMADVYSKDFQELFYGAGINIFNVDFK